MDQSGLGKLLIGRQSFINDGIRTFGVQFDPLVGTSHQHRHSLSGRVEFANIEDLVFFIIAVDINEYRFGFTSLSRLAEAELNQLDGATTYVESVSQHFGTSDQCSFIR